MMLSGHTVEVYSLKTKLGSLCSVWKTLLHTMGSISLLRALRCRYNTVPLSVYSILLHSGKALVCLTWFHLQMMKEDQSCKTLVKSCWKITSFCLLVICWLFHIIFLPNPPCFKQSALQAHSHIWNKTAFFCFRNGGKLPEECLLLVVCFRSKMQVTGCSCCLIQSKIQVKCAELNSPFICRDRWASICFSHCLGTKQRESNHESYRRATAWGRGSGSPPGLVWQNVGFKLFKLCLAALTVLELPPNWTLPMCSGIFLAGRKAIMFLNICWILGCEYILPLCHMNANSEKGRNFVLQGRSGQESLNISELGQSVQLFTWAECKSCNSGRNWLSWTESLHSWGLVRRCNHLNKGPGMGKDEGSIQRLKSCKNVPLFNQGLSFVLNKYIFMLKLSWQMLSFIWSQVYRY